MKLKVTSAVIMIRKLSCWVFFLLFCGMHGCAGRTPAIEAGNQGLGLSQPDAHQLFSEVLRNNVSEGRVNYPALCKDERLDIYLEKLAATDPESVPDRDILLAFWINAYNAYTLKVICDNYPLESIQELHFGGLVIGHLLKKTIWDKDFVVINGQNISLNDIEHHIIRANSENPEDRFTQICAGAPCPRAHLALVCASKSCPPLRSEAYEGYKLNEQLDEQGRIFFNDPKRNFFEPRKKVAHLNKILDWYAGDFGDTDAQILLFAAQFLPRELAEAIRRHPEEWEIQHTDYDWTLNE